MCGGSWNHRLVLENFVTCSHVQINTLQIINYSISFIYLRCKPIHWIYNYEMHISHHNHGWLGFHANILQLKQMQWCDLWAPEGLDTLPALSNANDTIRSFWARGKKDGFENSLKCLFVILAQAAVTLHTCSIKKWGLHSATESYADCVFCLVWLAGWVSHVKPTPGSGLLAQA